MAKTSGLLFDALEPKPSELNGCKIVIIDGHALAYRSYFAIQGLKNSKGQATNAVFGFVRALLKLLREEQERDATIVAFDAPAKTFRHERYEGYKAGRAPAPDDLPGQIRIIKRLVTLLGLHQIEKPGLEADDLIGTIAVGCESLGHRVEIVTSDRDAYQLVSQRVTVRGIDKSEHFGPDEVYEKYGVRVGQWVDYRALIGDASDNIPGAKGIGPKTAAKLLQSYETLEHILANLDTVKPESAAQKIAACLSEVKVSRELSRIVTDAQVDIDPHRWAQREIHTEALTELLSELEFGSIMRELGLSRGTSYEESFWSPDLVPEGLGYRLSELSPMNAELLDLAVAWQGKVAATSDEGEMHHYLSGTKEVHAVDAKALSVYARRRGLDVRPGDDPTLMAYLLDPGVTDPVTLAQRYGAGDWGDSAASRAVVTAELLKSLPGQFDPRLKELYETIERPVAGVLAEMELAGVKLDTALLAELSSSMAERLERIEAEVREVAGKPSLNLNSRDQLADLLYDTLELVPLKKTKLTGKRSTAVSALEPLKGEHPVIAKILAYRELSKLKGTYLDPLPRLVRGDSGRLHTTFTQTVTATGRLSSINPNLQNIPVRSEVGRQIRRAFIAEAGFKLLVADYSQIELRILAHIAGEEALQESFSSAEDIHRRTAAEIHGVAPREVTSEQRRVAKIINFGVLYGMSAHRLAAELDIDFDKADLYIKTYFARYPKVQAYIDETLAFARSRGYVETLLGRRRPIPDIISKNRNQREYAERTAYNMPIQGTQADIVKLAMIRLAPKLKEVGARMLLQVHDELVIEAPEGRAAEVAALTKETMQGVYELSVPIVAEVGIGDNWLEAK
ncbi:MAG: DNA polymerase I [Deinococcota bacterium]|nr:DNA polymerase I [Deinococcota bacterium]